jgi:hypothetical protein
VRDGVGVLDIAPTECRVASRALECTERSDAALRADVGNTLAAGIARRERDGLRHPAGAASLAVHAPAMLKTNIRLV